MSLIWNPKSRAEKWAERAATSVIILAALYFLGHVIAAWSRGSFGGWR